MYRVSRREQTSAGLFLTARRNPLLSCGDVIDMRQFSDGLRFSSTSPTCLSLFSNVFVLSLRISYF